MQRITAHQAAEKWGISLRRVQDLCRQGRIHGAEQFGKNWMIPADAGRPLDGRRREIREAKAEFTPMPRRSPMLSMTDLYQIPGSADRVSRSLAGNLLAQELFDAGIAYSRGEIDKVYTYARHFLDNHTGLYAVTGAGFLLALCAIWRGDMEMWHDAQHHIASAPCRSDTDREVLSLVLAAADSSVFDYREYPAWFERGCFDYLPPDSHPMAKVFYAKLLYMVGYGVATRTVEMEGIQGLGLMRVLPGTLEPMISQAVVDRTLIPEIYLRLYCAVSYHNSGNRDMAVAHIDRAIALALPDKLYGVLAVNWRILDRLLEERLALADPDAVRITKEMHRTFAAGQSSLGSRRRQRTIAINLSDRERQVAKLAAFGMKNHQIAERLGIRQSTVKTVIQKIMQKTGVTDRTDFVHIL